MLCISVAPQSRKLAKADLLNAAGQCDLVELCLDHLIKEPDVGDMLQGIPKPILVACRSSRDGGKFEGTEDERMTLLRQGIVAGPQYVELDRDVAAKVPRFGKTKRVLSVTTLDGPPEDASAVFEEAGRLNADVVKFAWPTPTFESIWPMLKILATKQSIPAVGLGIGRAAVTLALFARKLEAPWCYAALEKGLEAVPGQPTVSELIDIYHWDAVGPKTRFVGLLGPVDQQMAAVARTLNAAFRRSDERFLCVPLPAQSFERLRDRLDKLKVQVVLAMPDLAPAAAKIVDKREGSAETSGFADLLLHQPDGWTGYNTLWRHALDAVAARAGKQDGERPLERRTVLVIGSGGMARALIHGGIKQGGLVSVASPDDRAAQQLAQQFNVRHVPFHNLYDTLTEIVLIADAGLQSGHRKTDINAGYFRSTMTVMDLGAMPEDTPLLAEARLRGCKVVEPADVFRAATSARFESITGKKFPVGLFEELAAG